LTASAAERGRILDLRQSELEDRHIAIESRQTELDSLAKELAGQKQLLTQREAAIQALEGDCQNQGSDLDSRRVQLDDREAALHVQDAELTDREQKLSSREQALAAGERALTDREQKFAAIEQEMAARERACAASETQLADSQMQIEQRVEDLAVREVAVELAQKRLDTEVSTQSGLKTSWEEDRDRLCGDVVAAQAERDELRQKFELALADMQNLRGRVAEMEQELSTRPAADETASVELIQMRAERDALAVRIAELERQPAAPPAGDPSEEMEILQRRFELAVEDVRDLKRKNSDLESQLSEAKAHGVAAAPAGGGKSWESMKQQMLAQLAGEGDDGDSDRQEERATIESTIQITDDVVAGKDREIAELKARLGEDASERQAAADEYSVRELVDSDAVIQQHRERTSRLEQEMEQKLRAAEMELSLERAKIAREQAQLADLRAEIDSLRAAMGETGSSGGGQAPKRRWLSKLGLSGEDEK
jgi:chromosome segregation ATPase